MGKNGEKSGQPIVRQFGVMSLLQVYSSRQIKCKFKKQEKNGTDITFSRYDDSS
jgi:hypothetical protein